MFRIFSWFQIYNLFDIGPNNHKYALSQLHWKLVYELEMNCYWILGGHMRPKYRVNVIWANCSSSHAWLQSCDGPVLRGRAPASDIINMNDRGLAVEGTSTCWLQPLPTRTNVMFQVLPASFLRPKNLLELLAAGALPGEAHNAPETP